MPLANLLYNQGLQIYQALNTIVTPGATNAQISAAIGIVNSTTTGYQNSMSNMWNFLQPYFPHYNQQWVAAFRDWATYGVDRIDAALAPIILYGYQHGGQYSPEVIDAQRLNILTCMGDLNIFRNPYNAPQLQVPYFNLAHEAVELPEREELAPGDFDPDEIGLLTAAAETESGH